MCFLFECWRTYYEEDDYVLAEENYLKALDLNPNEYATYHNLGNLKNAQKDFELLINIILFV